MQHTVSFLCDNVPLHMEKPVCSTLETIGKFYLTRLNHLAPSDYHLFASMGHALGEQHFGLYTDIKNGSMNGLQQKGEDFYWCGIHKFLKRWEKRITSNEA